MSGSEIVTDWRGTPIVPGALVIYGAPYGSNSIAMVEATVADPMLTKSGRIRLDVIRRKIGGWGDKDKPVHVGPDRLTIVTALPPCELPTQAEKYAQERARHAEAERIYATHNLVMTVVDRWNHRTACVDCGTDRYYQQECTG